MNGLWRLIAIMSLAIALLAGPLAPVAAHIQPVTLTIHRRVCLPGQGGNLYQVCHGLPQRPGVVITLRGAESRGVSTDTAGNTVFEHLTPGLYFASDHTPGGDFTRHHVFCSAAESPGVPRPAGLSAIMLAAGDNVVCDWYITNPDMSGRSVSNREPVATPTTPPPLPAGTILTISSWKCPDTYVNENYAAACRRHPGTGFRYWAGHTSEVEAPAAGPDGRVRLDLGGSTSGTVIVASERPTGSSHYYANIVDCHAGNNRLETTPLDTLAAHAMIEVQVNPGDPVHCDWYKIP